MKQRISLFLPALVVVLSMSQVPVQAQTMPSGNEAAKTSAEAKAVPEPGKMSDEMMARMKEFSTPNENHERLELFVGSFDATVKMWMSPDGQPDVSPGSSNTQWILDKHFIEQTFKGTHMGQPFEGRWIIGYDNLKKEYVSVWVDSMSTGLNASSGVYDAATKTFTQKGHFSCPLKNGDMNYSAKTKIVDENSFVYEMYMPDETGKEFKAMEITYTRKK